MSWCAPPALKASAFPAAEAMACGAAVAASDGGALPEVVGDTGLISPVGDDTALADNIARLLDTPGLAEDLGAKAARRARKEFNWSAHALAATRLYAEALAERSPQPAC